MVYHRCREQGEIQLEEIGLPFFRQLEKMGEENRGLFTQPAKGILKIGNWVGVVGTPAGTLEVYPKIGENFTERRAILLKLLSSLPNSPFRKIPLSLSPQLSPFSPSSPPLLSLFVSHFLEEMEKIGKWGLYRGFSPEIVNSPFLTGKLLSAHFSRNGGRKERFLVEVEEVKGDTLSNRLLKTAQLEELKRRNRLLPSFRRFPKFYLSALQWAQLILGIGDGEIENGKNKLPLSSGVALIYTPSTLFERGVLAFLKKKIPSKNLHFHPSISIGGGRTLAPDAIINRSIFEIKWKKIFKGRDVNRNDIYQVMGYLLRFGLTRGFLVYPFTSPLPPLPNRGKILFSSFGKRIEIAPLFFDILREKFYWAGKSTPKEDGGSKKL